MQVLLLSEIMRAAYRAIGNLCQGMRVNSATIPDTSQLYLEKTIKSVIYLRYGSKYIFPQDHLTALTQKWVGSILLMGAALFPGPGVHGLFRLA